MESARLATRNTTTRRSRCPTTTRPSRPMLHADEAAADDELARCAQDAERAPGHAELAMVGEGAGVDLELAVDLAHGGVDVERDGPARGVQLPADLQGVAGHCGVVGLEADLRVVGDVE